MPSPSSPMPPATPDASLRFREGELLSGRWRIDCALPGAMGVVLLLEDPGSGGRYAAKTPLLGRGGDEGAIRRFRAEAGLWLSLGRHENVVEAFFLEEIEVGGVPRPFLFLEFVEGPTLESVLRAEGRLAVPVALDLATGIAWGLAHAHGAGRSGSRLVHRDLKPENVFVTARRVAQVADFGIARALDRPEESASEGAGLGTPYYAAPEQLKDARAADRRSDVYSYGAVLHQMLTGRPPFPAADLPTLVLRVLKERARAPSELAPGVPPELDRLVLACLEKDPANRPADFPAILDEISEVREIDSLWLPPPEAMSCRACGWLSVRPTLDCVLCGVRLGPGVRYAPVSRRSASASPTLGRHPGEGSAVFEGAEVRPRSPRAREPVVFTVLLGNPGTEAVEGLSVEFVSPDPDAFTRPVGASRERFVGTLPPTAAGAPVPISWSLIPLRAGDFVLRVPRMHYRTASGERREVGGGEVPFTVAPNDLLPLIGREAEVLSLTRAMDRVAQGGSSLVIVHGAAGTGKSRLMRHAHREAAERGLRAARGRCLGRGGEARGALREALRNMLGIRARDVPHSEAAAAVVDLLGESARVEQRLLRFLTGELRSQLDEQQGNPARMWARLACVIGRERPLLLVLEDVHLDPEVARIAHHMARTARREGVGFLALLTARSAPDEDVLAALLPDVDAALELTGSIPLGPLPGPALEALFHASLAPDDFDTTAPWLAAEVAHLCAGSPLALLEMVHALQTPHGDRPPLVVTDGGRWTAAADLTQERLRDAVPGRLERLVLARVEEFGSEALEFVEAAGVLGDLFETELLRTVLRDPTWFGEALRTLEESAILRELPAEPPRIRFREALLPELLERELAEEDPDRSRALHTAAADWLRGRPRPGTRYALRLGRHLAAGGRSEEAFQMLLEGVRLLVRRQSYAQAARVLEEVVSLCCTSFSPSRAAMSEYHLLRAEAMRFTGDPTGALAAYREVVAAETDASAPGKGDRAALATAYSKMGKVHQALGRYEHARECFEVGLSLRREAGDVRAVPLSLVNLAGLHAARREADQAEGYLTQAVAEAETVGNEVALGRALVLMGALAAARGETAEARRLVRRAVRSTRATRDKGTAAEGRAVLGNACLAEGRLAGALAHHRRALAIRQEIGDLTAVAASWHALGAVHEIRAEPEASLRAFRRAVELYRRVGSVAGRAAAMGDEARVILRQGRPRRAHELLERARRLAEGAEGFVMAGVLADLGRVQRLLGDVAGGAATLARAREILPACCDARVAGRLALARADAALAALDPEEAARAARAVLDLPGMDPDTRVSLLAALAESALDEAAAKEAEHLAARLASPWGRAQALAARGRLDLVAGRAEAAAGHLRRSAGLLLQAGGRNLRLLGVLVDQVRALEEQDPVAAAAALARARELASELVSRGYGTGPGTGFPLEGSEVAP